MRFPIYGGRIDNLPRPIEPTAIGLTDPAPFVSQKTQQDVVDVLAKAAKETAEEPAFQDALQKLNLNYAWLDAASFQTQISEQEKYFDELLTRLGLKK